MEKKYKERQDQNIDHYITQKMNGSTLQKFEQLMASDDTLAEEVAFRQGLIKAMKWKRQIAIAHEDMLKKNALAVSETGIRTSQQQEKPMLRIGFRRVLAYAASVGILALIGLSWFANNNYADSYLANVDGLVALESTTRTDKPTATDPFEKGLSYLEQKAYAKASSFFETIPPNQSAYAQARLYLAFSQYHTKEYSKALENAAIVQKENLDTKAQQKADWLVIQTQLAQGTKEAVFSNQLDSIATNPNHIYQQQAVQLRAKLTSFWRYFVL